MFQEKRTVLLFFLLTKRITGIEWETSNQFAYKHSHECMHRYRDLNSVEIVNFSSEREPELYLPPLYWLELLFINGTFKNTWNFDFFFLILIALFNKNDQLFFNFWTFNAWRLRFSPPISDFWIKIHFRDLIICFYTTMYCNIYIIV